MTRRAPVWRGWLRGALLLGLVGVGALDGGAQPASLRLRRPWGAAALADGGLVVMETAGRMLRLDPGSGAVSTLVPSVRPYQAIDVAAGSTPTGEETVFVSVRLTTASGGRFNRLRQYSLSGKQVGEWPITAPGVFAGIAVDAGRQVVYLGNAQTGEIYRLDLSAGDPASRLTRLPDTGILGPLAFDPGSDRIFTADTLRGQLYAVPVESRTPKLIAGDLGEPAALAVAARERRLFIADASGRRIWVVDLDAPEPVPRIFSQAEELRSPVGLTAAPDGTLWVCDPAANAVFGLGPGGSVRKRVE